MEDSRYRWVVQAVKAFGKAVNGRQVARKYDRQIGYIAVWGSPGSVFRWRYIATRGKYPRSSRKQRMCTTSTWKQVDRRISQGMQGRQEGSAGNHALYPPCLFQRGTPPYSSIYTRPLSVRLSISPFSISTPFLIRPSIGSPYLSTNLVSFCVPVEAGR